MNKALRWIVPAAALAIAQGCAVQDVPYPDLRKRLLKDGQVLSY